MQFGVFMFPTEYAISPTELGPAVEERGFDSLWFPEHTHIPTSRQSPWPGGAELPKEYSHTLDLFVAMTAVAATTKSLLIGSGICLVVERDPILMAKEVASVDYLSNGRVLFGIGGGWNQEEMANHGTDPAHRWKVVRERIAAMKAIWTQDEAEYHGEYVDFDPIWQWPKPTQKPHPPIIVGGDSPGTFKRVLDYGDGWMPLLGRGKVPIAERMAELSRLAAERGRGPIPVTIFGVPAKPEVLNHYAEIGVSRCLFGLPSAPREEILPLLDRRAELAASLG